MLLAASTEALLPLAAASTPAPGIYTDAEWYEAERVNLFHSSWVPVCRIDDVAVAGDYVAIDVAGEPVVVVRDRAGTLDGWGRRLRSERYLFGAIRCRGLAGLRHGQPQ